MTRIEWKYDGWYYHPGTNNKGVERDYYIPDKRYRWKIDRDYDY